MLERESNFKAWLYLAPALLLLGVFTFYPLFNAFFLAFLKDFSFLNRTAQGFTFLGNFITVVQDADFWLAMENTAWIVVVSVPVSVMVALLISVALHSIVKGQSWFQTIFFLPYVTNAIAVGMAFAFIFHTEYGLINTVLDWLGVLEWLGIDNVNFVGLNATRPMALTALLIYTVWGGLPFKIMVFLSGLQSIDKQYYQAAKIDSAPRRKVFWRITVPLLSPMLAYITITSFIGAFKAYRTVVGMFGVTLAPPGATGDERLITIVGLVYESLGKADVTGGISQAAATSIILFGIILLFTLFQMWVSRRLVHY